MFLAADIGNTNIVIAIHDGQSWRHKYRYETKLEQPEYFYESGLRDLLLEWNISPRDIVNSGISSVVPHLNHKIENAILTNTGSTPVILSPELFEKLSMRIPKIYEIGSDLVANAVAAMSMQFNPCIVIDFGTALSFTIVDVEGIQGVTIAPGLKTTIATLSGNTAQLPEIDIKLPQSAIGKSTSSAIRAGVLYGYIGLVKELISKIKSELNDDYKVIATGGLSTVLEELVPLYDQVDKNLTLEGIRKLVS